MSIDQTWKEDVRGVVDIGDGLWELGLWDHLSGYGEDAAGNLGDHDSRRRHDELIGGICEYRPAGDDDSDWPTW